MRLENVLAAVPLIEEWERLDRLQMDLASVDDRPVPIRVQVWSHDSVGVETRHEHLTPVGALVRRITIEHMENIASKLAALGVFRPWPTLPPPRVAVAEAAPAEAEE